MTRLLSAVLLSAWATAASAQPASVPVCNGTNGPNCTDYFGVGNWANSPLPAGTISGLGLVAGGTGYSNPIVVISDPTGSGATGTAIATSGVITSISGSGGSGYLIPQVTIVDVGPGGTLAAPACGGTGQPACGSGAMATANIGPPFTGGILKFQDALPTLASGLVVATPDTSTFPGSDYYEIALVQYQAPLHASLPPTTLRGYVQQPSGSIGCPVAPSASYLGPIIVAQKNRAVRVKFTNCLPAGAAGDLFIPTDTTYMGAGMGPGGASYTGNRATLHLHGGATPWISDGTPHQWTVPVGETSPLQRGDSVQMVPDMWFTASGQVIPQCSATVTTGCSPGALPAGATNDPGQGSLSFYWTNQQGGRLMFYHDHAYGLTRLNVYAGEAAGYLLVDPAEEDQLAAGTAPGTLGATSAPDLAHLIPLVIQDKTFVPSAAQIAFQDPTWAPNYGTTPGTANPGDLWFPHIYIPNQNPYDPGGANAFGRWDYGPWFFPPQTTLTAATPNDAVTVACASALYPGQTIGPNPTCPSCGCPITPNPSGTPEGFMDTPVVNGKAYPVLHVAPAAYRFRILSAGNDRSWNLSWFVADPNAPTEVAMLPAAPPAPGSALPLCPSINPVTNPSLDMGVAMALLDANGNPLNGTGLPASCWPNYGPQAGIPAPQTMWAADGRAGGAPDPRLAGPPWVQIGTEGGLLPMPVVIPATPVNYEQNTRSVTVTNVAVHGLWLGPAERADVIVDFSAFAGKTLILYNDASAPAPAFDSRNDFFTGDGDQSAIGGAPNTQPGYGPNTRTVMQVVVDQSAPNAVPFNLTALKAAFASTAAGAGVFAATQPTPIVPEAIYGPAYGTTYPNTYASIAASNLTFHPIAPLTFDNACNATPPLQCGVLDRKAIQELFTFDYGRMNATLGTELPLTNFLNQTTIPLGYIDPPTEIVRVGDTQLWKITHNGVDTHFIHFHLFNVQVVNRMGWDGTVRPPDPNEVGWKDTVRMNPLEDILVALQPIAPVTPFPLPNSVRFEDVTAAAGTSAQFTNVDPFTNLPATTANAWTNYGQEYVWHCHILGHEENDMMRPIVFQAPPAAPSNLAAANDQTTFGQIDLSWTDNSASETGFVLQRATLADFSDATTVATVAPAGTPNAAGEGTSWGATIVAHDVPPTTGTFYYRVQAVDDGFRSSTSGGLSQPYNATPPLYSAWSSAASASYLQPAVTFTGAPASAVFGTTFTVTATTSAADLAVMPVITGTAGVCTVDPPNGTPQSATALVTMVSGTGTCTLTASWQATPTYMGAVASQTTAAAKSTPAVAFTGAPATAVYATSFTVTATTNADTTVLPAITGTAGVCTVGAATGTPQSATATVTMSSGTGSCTLTATWVATSNYAAALATQTTAAALATPVVTFTGAPASAIYGTSFTVSATTTSDATALPSISGTAGICTVGTVTGTPANASATVTMTSGTGTCALGASWPATANYAAGSATQSTAAALATPTVTFTGAPASAVYATGFTVTATTTSSVLPAISGTAGVCTVGPVSGTPSSATATVTMASGTGTCALTASWPATANFSAATASQSTSAALATPAVTFTGAPASAVYGTSFAVSATTTSDSTALPAIASATPGVCTVGAVTGSPASATATVTMASGTGTCTLGASWPATSNFSAASATQSTTAARASPAVTFTGAPPSAPYDAQFGVTATTTSSALPTISGTAGVCGVSMTGATTATVTMLTGTGTCTLAASWPADTNYTGASATQTTAATKVSSATAIASVSPGTTVVAGQPITVAFTVASGVALSGGASGPAGSVTVSSSTGQSCSGTLAAGSGSCTLALPTAGAVTLTASYAGDANFNPSTSGGFTEQVQDFKISIFPASNKTSGGSKANYTVTVTSLNGLAGTVNLACTGTYPSSWSCSASPTSVGLSAAGANAAVTVSTKPFAPGTYTVTTTGTYGTGVPATGGLTHTTSATVTTTK